MDTINAGLIAPTGYARTYDRYDETARDFVPVRVELAGDVIGLILDREDGSVVDWLTNDSGVEFAATIAHAGIVVIREDIWQNLDAYPVAGVAVSEAALYADCFGVWGDTLPASE